MKISELSERSDLTVQTIKFYIRSGLLPKGRSTSPTRSEYDEVHLERLRLIRVLREVGGLPVAAICSIMQCLDDDGVGLDELFATTQHSLGPHVPVPLDDPEWTAARRRADALVADLELRVRPGSPARDLLAQTFLALERIGSPVDRDCLRPYVDAARSIADHEAASLCAEVPRTEAVRSVLVSTLLYEQVLVALHRMAQEDVSARRVTVAP